MIKCKGYKRDKVLWSIKYKMWPLPQHNMNIQMRNGDDDIGTTFTILLTTTFREIDNYTLFVWVIYGQKTRNNLSPNVKYLKWILFPKNYRFDFDVQFKEMMIGSYGYQLSNYSFIKECCQTILCFLLSVCICWYRLKTKNLIVCKQSTILSKMSTTIVLEFV